MTSTPKPPAAQLIPLISILEQDQIIPQILAQPPTLRGKLSIAYPAHTICMGETVERNVTLPTPTVHYEPFNGKEGLSKEDKYTLIMVDPDLLQPNDTVSGQVRHWLQPNMTFDPATIDNKGKMVGRQTDGPITEYLECSPGPPGHKHRYVFILAIQSPNSPPDPSGYPSSKKSHEDVKDRAGFNVDDYIKGKGMEVVGITFMKVGPNLSSMVENAKLSGEAIVNKVMGK